MRNAIITTNEALQERELLKLMKLSGSVADALVARGAGNLEARLAGDLLVAVFASAFSQWIDPAETRDLVELQRESLAAFRALASV